MSGKQYVFDAVDTANWEFLQSEVKPTNFLLSSCADFGRDG